MTCSPMTEQATDWFAPDVEPVYSGWYERRYRDGTIVRDCWLRRRWWAGICGTLVPADGGLPWRGMRERIEPQNTGRALDDLAQAARAAMKGTHAAATANS